MNYLKRMFSWKGEAGRLEFLGFQLLPFGLVGLFGILPIGISSWFEWNLPLLPKVSGFIIGVWIVVISVLAMARRLRHLGWPVWLAFLWLVPGINFFAFVFTLVLIFAPSRTGKEAQQPPYFWPNFTISLVGILLPLFLIFGLVFMAKKNPSLLIKLMPQAKVEAYKQEKAQKAAAKNENPVNVPESVGLAAGSTEAQTADIAEEPLLKYAMQPVETYLKKKDLSQQEHATKNPYLMTSPARTRTNKIPGDDHDMLYSQIEAPNTSVLADRLKWDMTPKTCGVCSAFATPYATGCTQFNMPSQKATLCIISLLSKEDTKQIHQIVVDKYNMPMEDVLFEQNRPVALARYQRGVLRELFTQRFSDQLHFFRILKPIETDWTDPNGEPSPYYTDITIQIYPNENAWVPFYNYDARLDGAQGSWTQDPNRHTFTTQFKDFNPSTRFVEMLYGKTN